MYNANKTNDSDTESYHLKSTVLRRIDPGFKRLYGSATQVAVFKFNSITEEWNPTDTTGGLYLYSRNDHPEHGLIVMNRKNLNDFVQKFDSNECFILELPYIMIKAKTETPSNPLEHNPAIYCIWFYEIEDCFSTVYILQHMGLKFEGVTGNETFGNVGKHPPSPCVMEPFIPADPPSPSPSFHVEYYADNGLMDLFGNRKDISKEYCASALTAEQLEAIIFQEDGAYGRSEKVKPSDPSALDLPSVTPLTKDQLQKGFMYLLQNDDGFVKKLHDGYLKSIGKGQGERHQRRNDDSGFGFRF